MQVTRITPSGPSLLERTQEFWRFRSLFGVVVERAMKIRFKQTLVGPAWVVLQPVILTVAFTIVFDRLAHVSSDNLPYPVFAFSGLGVWTFFTASLLIAANSLVNQQEVVSKVYFPRIILPTAVVVAFLLDLFISVAILFVLMGIYGVTPRWTSFLAIPWLLDAFVFTTALGWWLSALAVKYRDIRIVLPFLVQLGLFVTPIAYPASAVPRPLRFVFDLNPMTAIVGGFRSAFLGTPLPTMRAIALSLAVVVAVIVIGLTYFIREERYFADVI